MGEGRRQETGDRRQETTHPRAPTVEAGSIYCHASEKRSRGVGEWGSGGVGDGGVRSIHRHP
ncbi:MAG: hypothetical protein F6K24_04795 [Okeania sp. SIO2D1]|nr:hypothetical protein [Okeania sp. SIO2D1]